MKMLKSIALAGTLAVACMELLGCSTTHGDYQTTTIAGGLYKRVSTGYGETMQLNLLWIPIYKNY